MSMFLLSCVCDSITAKLCEGCRCVTEIHEAGTNCHDVCIVFVICVAIVLVALIAKWAIGSWKDAEQNAIEAERKAKIEKEKEESDRKIKSNLLDKYIELVKENKTILNCEAGQEYKQVLAYLIEKSQQGKMNEITQTRLMEKPDEESSSNPNP